MDIAQLKYFHAVAEYQNITHAAETLHITQPALSSSINRLESELGVQLLDRVGRNVILNKCGKVFLTFVNTTLTALKNVQAEMEDINNISKNTINLSYYSKNFLSHDIVCFENAYPHIYLNLNRITEESIFHEVNNPNCDFVLFSTGFPDVNNCEKLVFCDNKWMIAISKSNPLSEKESLRLSDISEMTIICNPEDKVYARFLDSLFKEAGLPPPAKHYAAPWESVPLIVDFGFIAFANNSQTSKNMIRMASSEKVSFLPLPEEECNWFSVLCWSNNRKLTKAANQFLDFLQIAHHDCLL